jgi:integrase
MSKNSGWKATFNSVLQKHNGYSADGGKVASYATQKQRHDVLLQGFRALREMGFKFKTVKALRGSHITRLIQKWEKSNLSTATIRNRLSTFRTFSNWIGKKGMVLPLERYTSTPSAIKSRYMAVGAKKWPTLGVSIGKAIKSLRDDYRRLSWALELQLAFGLRSKESLLIRPHLADKGDVLVINHGTKGGRTRYLPIETPSQRELLNRLKAKIPQGASLVPKDKTYAQFRNEYYYALRKHGICRKNGITAHGLRHEHLTRLYERATGHKAPIDGGTLRKKNKALDSLGRQLVSERAGHNRESISSAYIGGKK